MLREIDAHRQRVRNGRVLQLYGHGREEIRRLQLPRALEADGATVRTGNAAAEVVSPEDAFQIAAEINLLSTDRQLRETLGLRLPAPMK